MRYLVLYILFNFSGFVQAQLNINEFEGYWLVTSDSDTSFINISKIKSTKVLVKEGTIPSLKIKSGLYYFNLNPESTDIEILDIYGNRIFSGSMIQLEQTIKLESATSIIFFKRIDRKAFKSGQIQSNSKYSSEPFPNEIDY